MIPLAIGDSTDGYTFPDQLLASRIDDIDIQRSLCVLLNPGLFQISRPGAVEPVAITIITKPDACPRNGTYVNLLIESGIEIDEQLRAVQVVLIPEPFQSRAGCIF